MSITKSKLVSVLSANVPSDILTQLLSEYELLKQHFFLKKYQPTELNGARFCECVLRILQHISNPPYTPFGVSLDSEKIIKNLENDVSLQNTIRFHIPRLIRVILDVRNKRDVAHVGGEVNPNYSDSLFVIQSVDWILTEIVRHFYKCNIDDARKVVSGINEMKIPVIAEVDGFVKVQNIKLNTKDKTLLIIYYKYPDKVRDDDLITWLKYSNASRYRSDILAKLDSEMIIHYHKGLCTLLPKGIAYVEKNVPPDIII